MGLDIVRGDITTMAVDAIVNAANPQLQMGGGVCGAIFRAAGARRLREACDRLAPIATGEAVITDGFSLPARYIIHTPGPVWRDGTRGEEDLLRACYRNSLALAAEHGCASVAFPLISGGIYGYPVADAIRIALEEMRAFLMDPAHADMTVILALFDETTYGLARHIDERYPGRASWSTTDDTRQRSGVIGVAPSPRASHHSPRGPRQLRPAYQNSPTRPPLPQRRPHPKSARSDESPYARRMRRRVTFSANAGVMASTSSCGSIPNMSPATSGHGSRPFAQGSWP